MKALIPRLIVVFFLINVLAAACSNDPKASEKVLPARLEEIEGSEYKQVILTEKAAERIGLQTALVEETTANPTLRVGGEVVPPVSSGESGSSAVSANALIYVRVNKGSVQNLDQQRPAMIIPLTGKGESQSLAANSVETLDFDGDKEDEDADDLYLELVDGDSGLEVGERVFVELPLVSESLNRKVVPYAAVIYGLEGETWVYVNPEPLVFVRVPIIVDYIFGDQAILIEGPEVGARVVVMGVAELYGAETGVSK